MDGQNGQKIHKCLFTKITLGSQCMLQRSNPEAFIHQVSEFILSPRILHYLTRRGDIKKCISMQCITLIAVSSHQNSGFIAETVMSSAVIYPVVH